MNRTLRIGLWILGIGALSFFAMGIFGGHWGPCGPSSIWGLIFLLIWLLFTPIGALISLVGFVIHRRRPAPQTRPETS